jgi:hypothetical protein
MFSFRIMIHVGLHQLLVTHILAHTGSRPWFSEMSRCTAILHA